MKRFNLSIGTFAFQFISISFRSKSLRFLYTYFFFLRFHLRDFAFIFENGHKSNITIILASPYRWNYENYHAVLRKIQTYRQLNQFHTVQNTLFNSTGSMRMQKSWSWRFCAFALLWSLFVLKLMELEFAWMSMCALNKFLCVNGILGKKR